MGVPVIFLDILAPLYVDPLFECAFFKRTVKKAEELLPCVQDFFAMGDVRFFEEFASAQEYLRKDFYPVTEKNLTPFYAA
jgi:hypothetical protein